ncbi:p48 [Antheraea pernyi nucleopolyhedrovirus]|uniref:p48 n=2 Tax=Antheraea pernyi nuclear polyhedrosis virus TaxID=161494 RepID=Q1HH42_NPVAP|nr:p48 [Antheraea pernyi nucleopolyhedrovirus]BBD50508.1 P48 [Antheraea yamamai nucleopolyhedrovirus]BBD50660.1 P48 [Samia cynthia nucleopolyhedrovirus]BBD50813.1 P48 [Antheraea proylei nucleopolyhedrovirus]ABF50292.1 p48 [Antheraea pernyi nucleopolyhedrovirus]ABQ12281.1 P48 [Antheraea pernyi nucleopolyhedrovirus]
MCTYKLTYNLRFNAVHPSGHSFEQVRFEAQLLQHEIDSLTFLLAKYFDQHELVDVQGLTFFTEFNKCIVAIKARFESQPSSEDLHNIKSIMSMFLRDEFIKQVPNFKTIMEYLKVYYNPVAAPDAHALMCAEHCRAAGKISCLQCKCSYLSCALFTLDAGLQDGWDIFLRPMFGIPLLLYVILKTDFGPEADVINENNLMTQIFVQFFYNLLCDKAYALYTKHKMCEPLVKDCRRVIGLLRHEDQHRLLSILNAQCNGSSTVANGERLLTPFRSFMIKMGHHTKIKKVNKIASTVLIGFYLRHYLESVPNKVLPAGELEMRNVCRFIMNKYSDENVDELVRKIKLIKIEILHALMTERIVPETFIRRIITDYKLDNEIALLMNLNHD